MEEELFLLVQDKQRKCLYLTLASTFKNSEGLEVVEKIPNAGRAIQALQKYSKQKVFGKLNLKDALGEDYGEDEESEFDDDHDGTYSGSAKGIKIDRPRADQEMKKHSHQRGSPEWEEYEKIFGKRLNKPGDVISATELLNWLGY